ncbi:hypothetical protein HMJ29_05480 [Hymenobacter taeanensis]|uniref:Uncharacterized protein n=1 Tax=Hymenobacter taeanensis TaxID=2735321 RepID=A0A6M6BHA6_9BACT|nr:MULTISPECIES: hypothetical protein [Hymenobacter]QJX46415.1 hypothetical protein HMJ29_05480 [Hymenobacter taeanensis]UOQ80276.1 hypothetical protein MUN83_15795 [Hymenobacter sp. 5414T-23]
MNKLTRGMVVGAGLLWPALAYAGEREEKYTLLLAGGIGGLLVGALLYTLLMLLAAVYLKHKLAVTAAFAVCVLLYLDMEYLSFQTLRVALGLMRTPTGNPGPVPLTFWLLLLPVGALAVGLLVFRIALRLWRKRQRPVYRHDAPRSGAKWPSAPLK